ncbi:MAG: tRNA (adenosine(37)-N6)-threonylcarbamoyltransferase complex dimerization subunit type 1 TsaB, partial [Muribaculaceae bacterium]|nr:tRNA (adenosine(37)-N6)-threonylcarbamoyltransferase complex dimerization subunit type 1 TsaB [Muribaculaceae bacterium]
ALNELMSPQPLILDENSYADLIATGRPLLLFGNGSAKAADVVKGQNVKIIEGVDPLAVDMIALAERAYTERKFVDLAYSVPVYLKDFVATKPKKLI